MLTHNDLSSLQGAYLDEESIMVTTITRCFTSVHEELILTVVPSGIDESEKNRQFTLDFIRDGEEMRLSAFVILQEIEYQAGAGSIDKVLRFGSLGGYTITPADSKE